MSQKEETTPTPFLTAIADGMVDERFKDKMGLGRIKENTKLLIRTSLCAQRSFSGRWGRIIASLRSRTTAMSMERIPEAVSSFYGIGSRFSKGPLTKLAERKTGNEIDEVHRAKACIGEEMTKSSDPRKQKEGMKLLVTSTNAEDKYGLHCLKELKRPTFSTEEEQLAGEARRKTIAEIKERLQGNAIRLPLFLEGDNIKNLQFCEPIQLSELNEQVIRSDAKGQKK